MTTKMCSVQCDLIKALWIGEAVKAQSVCVCAWSNIILIHFQSTKMGNDNNKDEYGNEQKHTF